MGSAHDFGGEWTQRKLSALRDYLNFYTKALKAQRFKLMYVDAFAGTGRVGGESTEESGNQLVDEPERRFFDGSAQISLDVERPFDRYVFFDAKHEHVEALRSLADAYPKRDIQVERHDANKALRDLARDTDWNHWRAVVFLDPYGTQVEWETLEALANTQSVDIWLLVPFGVAYGRMLPNSGEVPDSWADRLTKSFGTDEWRNIAYEQAPSTIDMFSGVDVETRRKKLEDIERWFRKRLELIFPKVGDPIYLENSTGTWLYSLYFAIANPNPRAQGLAMKVANHITDKLGDSRGTI